jgi:hypothetical protein
MKRNRRFLTPALLAGTVGLLLAGSGCVIETGPDGSDYGGCYPNLIIDYTIQDATGVPVTCGAAGAASVQANVDGVIFPVSCPRDSSAGSIVVPLQGVGLYNATVNLLDRQGNALAPAQSSSFNITSCGDTEPATPAVFVVSVASPATP